MGEKMPISVFDAISHLEQERYRAVVIHTVPEKSPSMSLFFQKLCKQANGKYLDLLEFFIQSPALSESIDRFSPEKFRGLLIEQSQGRSLLVVDRADFLLDTWRKSERQDFFRFINNQWDSYKDGMKAKLIIGLQTSQEIEALKILDSKDQSRIFRLHDFNDIG
ncbi:hypothetical protein LTAR_02087 [Leptolinea tardivitalis]|nr:hypothetical protein LTAR_02087 [Leptolinea tardivitalis]